MSLVFEVAASTPPPDLSRADVACFIGYVARRPGRPLPAALREQLRAGGWVDGLWRRTEAQLQSLENLPVTLDSWQLFDWLYAWDERPLSHEGDEGDRGDEGHGTCATYLGAAVRSFFSRGGRRAIVIRAGDPWPYLEDAERRAARRRERIRRLLPDFAERGAPARPFQPHDPASWLGIHHLYGLREASLVLLPDLPDACTYEPAMPEVAIEPPALPEGFVECGEGEADPPEDRGLRALPAPRLDSRGYAAWQLAMASAVGFLADPRHRREVMLLAALPLPDVSARRVSAATGGVHAQSDLLAYLRRIGVLAADGGLSRDAGTASAFVQLGWPWLRTAASQDLPESLEPPDGALAGLVAAGATLRGTFRSVAGDFSMPRLRDVAGAVPLPSWTLAEDDPTARLARHVCVFAPLPGGWSLQSDVTTSALEAWRFGGASRLMGTIVRAARAAGDAVVFDANGPALWAQLRGTLEDLLTGFWHEGAFAGASASEAFSVRCDPSTMTQNDIDAGRLVAHISVRPAASIERITVVLNLATSGAGQSMRSAA